METFDPDNAPDLEEAGLHLPSVMAACGAALVGAIVWAVISKSTGYEVGYVAWAIGGLVGFSVVKAGGRGPINAGVAAGITLAAIFLGKVLVMHFLIKQDLDQIRTEDLTRDLYNEMEDDATAFVALPPTLSDDDLSGFIYERGYGGFDETGEVTADQVAAFREYSVPMLNWMNARDPSFEEWQDRSLEDMQGDVGGLGSVIKYVIDQLALMDLIFAGLAVTTAFGLVSRAD